MSTVYLDSPTNSTMFTTCCECAICGDQAKCPKCGEQVEPRMDSLRWMRAYGRIRQGLGYGNPGPRKHSPKRSVSE